MRRRYRSKALGACEQWPERVFKFLIVIYISIQKDNDSISGGFEAGSTGYFF
jgi:hypothetical protein